MKHFKYQSARSYGVSTEARGGWRGDDVAAVPEGATITLARFAEKERAVPAQKVRQTSAAAERLKDFKP